MSWKFYNASGALKTFFPQPAPAMVKLDEKTGTGVGGTISFTSIPATYKHLVIMWDAVQDNAADQNLNLTVNNDGTANYDWQIVAGSAAVTSAASGAAVTSALVGVASSTASGTSRSSGRIELQNYAGALRKSWTGQYLTFGTTSRAGGLGGQWRGTSAINRIDISVAAGNIVSGSVFSLYGIT